jgi:hypothetical protein
MLALLLLQFAALVGGKDAFGMAEGAAGSLTDAAAGHRAEQHVKTEGNNNYRVTCAELPNVKMLDPNNVFEQRYKRAFEKVCADEKAGKGLFTESKIALRKGIYHTLHEGLKKGENINTCELTYSNWASGREALGIDGEDVDEPAPQNSEDRILFNLATANIRSADHIITWGFVENCISHPA